MEDRFVSTLDHRLEPQSEVRRFEVINGAKGRRRWSADDRARILEETLIPGAVVSAVARRHGLTPQQVAGREWPSERGVFVDREGSDGGSGGSEARARRCTRYQQPGPATHKWQAAAWMASFFDPE
ncbi:hypothetical protein SLNSH_04380 [Alsobacter soli]|uniref:Transposase n=1 Tax=Alsobacter soli TaxID=2109933 RepID=A0A2T1HWI5_9HYPH|nr:hypothetical protein SLNSH_04380 [Alsobacter soli]